MHHDSVKKRAAAFALALSLAIGAVAALAWFYSASPRPVSVAARDAGSLPHETSAEQIPNAQTPQPAWPSWGGALSSARQDGTDFFNRLRALEFSAATTAASPELAPYIIDLNARALLPSSDPNLADVLDLARAPAAAQTAYVQFTRHLNDAERDAVQALGLELLAYVSGRAWSARGTPAAFAAALQSGRVRGLARIDPRDKLNPQVFAGKIPAYATAADGRARLSLIARAGTAAHAIQQRLSANPVLASAVLIPQSASVLGPRFEIVADAALAPEIAALDDAAYVGLVAPPAASRDANTDRISNIDDVRDNPPNLTGDGVKVAVREIGKPDLHLDFGSRITFVDNDGSTFFGDMRHATAVVGQIASNGVNQPAAKGVATGVSIVSYALASDAFLTPDIIDAAGRGARISNHSYGPSSITVFGDYDPISADWDGAMRDNDLVGFFASNEESGGISKHIDFFVGAKNTLCITATTSAANAGDDDPAAAKSDGIAPFAEFGPMNDGRVKPDLAAFGDKVTLASGTSSTQVNSGTSFSTPAAAGAAALIFQHYKNISAREPSAALTKALMCNTATDVGALGPDSVYGFGIMNVEAAISAINRITGPANSPFVEDAVADTLMKTYTVNIQGAAELRATLCWMDLPGNPTAAKALVNDLSLELVSPDGTTFFPFSLSASSPLAPATTTGPNSVDPIEQIAILSPLNGDWLIRVVGTSIPSGVQNYALAVNQLVVPPALSAVITASPETGTAPLTVRFSSEMSTGNINKYRWDFGDGSILEAPAVISAGHIYAVPGNYTVTLTLDDTATATRIIRVTKPGRDAQANKGKAKLNFRGPEIANDDSIAFAMLIPGMTSLAGKPITIRIGGTTDNTVPASKIAEAVLDGKGGARTTVLSAKSNQKTGELRVQLKNVQLEELFRAAGMSRDPASTGIRPLPVEVETDLVIYRAILNFDYKNKNGSSGSAKSIP